MKIKLISDSTSISSLCCVSQRNVYHLIHICLMEIAIMTEKHLILIHAMPRLVYDLIERPTLQYMSNVSNPEEHYLNIFMSLFI